MIAIIAVSNVLVLYPFTPFGLDAWLTWSAFTYPFVFLVNDLANRLHGVAFVRRMIFTALPPALLISWLASASWRVALASLCAWLLSQLLESSVFDWLRRQIWWQAPLISSMLASCADTGTFFTLAFIGATDYAIYFPNTLGLSLPLWIGWASGDLLFKLMASCLLLIPYRLGLARLAKV